jgi:hypothetical protein
MLKDRENVTMRGLTLLTESNSNRAAILNFRDQLKAVTSGDITSVDSIAWPFAKTEKP